jgi:hypothetical protein
MEQLRCEGCGNLTAGYDLVNYGSKDRGNRQLCTQCFNTEVARQFGLADFSNVQFEPVGMIDCSGQLHQFHFQTRLLGNIVSLEAFELRQGNPGGYQFQMVGDSEGDLFTLLGQLIEKIRRALSIKHVAEDGHGLQIVDQTVRGRIDWDETEDDRVPLVVVDGQEISWEAFGRMLMTFEGWQFRLELIDRSEEP